MPEAEPACTCALPHTHIHTCTYTHTHTHTHNGRVKRINQARNFHRLAKLIHCFRLKTTHKSGTARHGYQAMSREEMHTFELEFCSLFFFLATAGALRLRVRDYDTYQSGAPNANAEGNRGKNTPMRVSFSSSSHSCPHRHPRPHHFHRPSSTHTHTHTHTHITSTAVASTYQAPAYAQTHMRSIQKETHFTVIVIVINRSILGFLQSINQPNNAKAKHENKATRLHFL